MMLHDDFQNTLLFDSHVTVAIRCLTNDDDGVLSFDEKNRICVRDRTSDSPRRYNIPHLFTRPPCHAHEWCKIHAQEVAQKIKEGIDVSVVSFGQSGLSKRELMFETKKECFGVCPNLLGILIKSLQSFSKGWKMNCAIWSVANGVITDLTASSDLYSFDVERLKTVAIESVGDVIALLTKALRRASVEEWKSHLFVRFRIEGIKYSSRSELHFVDISGHSICASNSVTQPEDQGSASAVIPSLCQTEIKEFWKIIGRHQQQNDTYSPFGSYLGKVLKKGRLYGVCSISQHPEHLLDTIASLRLSVRMYNIKARLMHSLTSLSKRPTSLLKDCASSTVVVPERKSSRLVEDSSLVSNADEDPFFTLKVLAENKDLATLQDTNRTLLSLLDKQKRLQMYIQEQLDASKRENEEILLQSAIAAQNHELEVTKVQNKCRQLEKASPFEFQFEIYEQETSNLLQKLKSVEEENEVLAEKVTQLQLEPAPVDELSLEGKDTSQKSVPQLQREVKMLRRKITPLAAQNLELRKKERCYDFYKQQCKLLMEEVRRMQTGEKKKLNSNPDCLKGVGLTELQQRSKAK